MLGSHQEGSQDGTAIGRGVHQMDQYSFCGLAQLTDCDYSQGVCMQFVNCAGRSLHFFLPPFGLGAIGHWAGDNSICCL